jgi:DNA polymerase III subunit delta'
MTGWLGHDRQQAAIIDAHRAGRIPHAWLLTGPRGIGKAAFARRAALFLLADGNNDGGFDIDDDHGAARLVASGAHPEFLWLKRELPKSKRDTGEIAESDLARNITVDQVRDLIGRMRVKPAIARYRTVVIDSIDDLERGAANALLKTIEEPPENTIFFLVSHNPGRLLPTIRSRCRTLPFTPLADADMAALLDRDLSDADAPTRAALVAIGRGSPGRALGYARQQVGDIATLLETIARTGDPANQGRAQLAKMLSGASEKQRFEAMLTQAVALASSRILAAQVAVLGDALATRERLLAIASTAIAWSEDAASVSVTVGNALAGAAKR